MTTVLAVVAHPDDEVLGCGGTLARHAAAGADVHCIIVAEGATSRYPKHDNGTAVSDVSKLRDAAANACAALGASLPRMLGLPDNRLDGLDLLDIIKPIEEVISELRPSIIYTHHGGDLSMDHRMTAQATLTACRPVPDSPVKEIYAFETVSSTEWASMNRDTVFQPQHFVNISANWPAKKAALMCYASELRAFPHPRSPEAIEALARWRGAAVGIDMAEAFEVVRQRIV